MSAAALLRRLQRRGRRVSEKKKAMLAFKMKKPVQEMGIERMLGDRVDTARWGPAGRERSRRRSELLQQQQQQQQQQQY